MQDEQHSIQVFGAGRWSNGAMKTKFLAHQRIWEDVKAVKQHEQWTIIVNWAVVGDRLKRCYRNSLNTFTLAAINWDTVKLK